MRFHSAISDSESTPQAVEAVIASAKGALAGKIDLAFAFFTAHHNDEAEAMLERLWLELDPQCLLGCSAEGVIGEDREVERSPGLAVLAADLPGVRTHPFHIGGSEWAEVLSDKQALAERIAYGPQTRAIIGFGDPFTARIHQLLPMLDEAAPRAPLIGGMASGGRTHGQTVLFRNDQLYSDSFVGVSLAGPVAVETVVSQGCRPIGRPMVVTRSHQNVIEQLGGRPALTALRDMIVELPEDQQQMLQNGLLIGLAISEYKDRFGRGDFLIRNLLGISEQSGAIQITDYARTGQTVQFHVRDAGTADEDLSLLLAPQSFDVPAAGGLLFSCNGRGTHMFPQPCHDIAAAGRAMPRTPVAGFFAAGEFGPVGGKNFIHGHTASFALFRPDARRENGGGE